jgi:hypothetical protein
MAQEFISKLWALEYSACHIFYSRSSMLALESAKIGHCPHAN